MHAVFLAYQEWKERKVSKQYFESPKIVETTTIPPIAFCNPTMQSKKHASAQLVLEHFYTKKFEPALGII